ncbi:ARM repeat-containing protein [Fomitiporia mediterranea MF3/22]|uniref:ARM repeat-containing protein n=1 Tax=Fomitiporia mediterranea (strain MF3/22) TaxID=694068 RepID=UPI00044081A3|nr:ARM repeat-containing protein [Fomitiporia mediterranea MF3/22]EJD04201.1 ARM repeat-containing protein [Fomitiporia mediterranea MF3/22]
MQSTSSSSSLRHQFIPLLPDPHSRARQHSAPSSTSLNASIWAPQPKSPGGTWPKDTHGFAEHTVPSDSRPNVPQHGFFPVVDDRPFTREDVFGLPSGIKPPPQTGVGAIGEGRQKDAPFREAEHVELLLRSLDLNSPAPEQLSPAVDFDVSPSTSSSFPNTPVESSPTTPRSSDTLFHHFNELSASANNVGLGFSSQNGILPVMQKQSQGLYWGEVNPAALRNDFTHTQAGHQATFQQVHPFDRVSENRPPLAFATALNCDHRHAAAVDWNQQPFAESPCWSHLTPPLDGRPFARSDYEFPKLNFTETGRTGNTFGPAGSMQSRSQQNSVSNEPINFLSLLHPSSTPPYALFVSRIVKSSDQQASIFLQQKLKVADEKERAKIVDAICTRGTEMMSHRFGNWAVQRCLEAASSVEERRKIAACMRGNVVELATNCYGCHVLQKALDCEEDIRLLIVSELLLGDPAKTLINKHASHVWSKIMEISWTPPAPPIFSYVNKALQGKWASLACHETGSLVVQHAFENLEESAKDGIVDELLNRGPLVFADVAKNQWGSYCIQHILEHGSYKHRDLALSLLLAGLLEFATNEQGFKSVTKALKEGGKDTLDKFVNRMRESPPSGRRAIIVDLALSTTGSQLIASVLPNIDKDQRTTLYDAIRGHIVTLRGCKTGSKVIWLLCRAYYGS